MNKQRKPSTLVLIILIITSYVITNSILHLITPIIRFYSQNIWIERGIGIVLVVIIWSISWTLITKGAKT